MNLDAALSILLKLRKESRTALPGLRGEICVNAAYVVRLLGEAIQLISDEANRPEAPLPEWMGAGPHYVVATEYDSDAEIYTTDSLGRPALKHPWLKSPSSIIHEHKIMADTNLCECRKRGASFLNRYGRAAIFRLELVEVLP